MSENTPTTSKAANEGVAAAQKKVAEARAAKQAEAKAAYEKRQSEITTLRQAIGKDFTGEGDVIGTIVDFQKDKLLGMKVADAYLINLGNQHRNDYVFCDDFSNKYTIKQ